MPNIDGIQLIAAGPQTSGVHLYADSDADDGISGGKKRCGPQSRSDWLDRKTLRGGSIDCGGSQADQIAASVVGRTVRRHTPVERGRVRCRPDAEETALKSIATERIPTRAGASKRQTECSRDPGFSEWAQGRKPASQRVFLWRFPLDPAELPYLGLQPRYGTVVRFSSTVSRQSEWRAADSTRSLAACR